MGYTIYSEGDEAMPTKEQIGSKAFNLAELESSGFPVPNHFVISTDVYENYLHSQQISETIYTQLIAEFESHFNEDELVAVRSSANFEDSADDSFAGVYESYLNITKVTLREAIINVYKSVESSQAQKYYAENGIDPSKVKMAVIIQKQIDPLISGVCFTRNPINGDNQVIIEYTEGLNEAFVQGEVTPERIIIGSNGEFISFTDPKYAEAAQTATDSFLKVERYFGKPQDIEWAIDKSGKLFILQSRDITTIDDSFVSETNVEEGQVIAHGIGISSGRVEGSLNRVDTNLTAVELKKVINKGDIIVAHSLRIDQIEAITEAGGIILSEASLLSHIAIRARELKIPCVGGIDIETLLQDGTKVTLNGANGIISIGNVSESEVENTATRFPTYYNPDKVQVFNDGDLTFLYVKDKGDVYVYLPKVGDEALIEKVRSLIPGNIIVDPRGAWEGKNAPSIVLNQYRDLQKILADEKLSIQLSQAKKYLENIDIDGISELIEGLNVEAKKSFEEGFKFWQEYKSTGDVTAAEKAAKEFDDAKNVSATLIGNVIIEIFSRYFIEKNLTGKDISLNDVLRGDIVSGDESINKLIALAKVLANYRNQEFDVLSFGDKNFFDIIEEMCELGKDDLVEKYGW